jgi:hypothetical protein
MPNIKFSDFTFEAPNGTAQLVGYRSTVNFRSNTTSLADSLGTADLVDLTSEQEVTGSKLFTSTLMLGESSAASMSGATLYSNSSNASYWVFNSELDDDLKAISFRSNNSARWEIAVNDIAQDLSFNFYNDAGVLQTSALYLSRSNGQVRMTQSLRLDVNLRVDNNSIVLSNAELQRLSGVSSNIQTQLNLKQDNIPTDDITKLLDGTISFRNITSTDVPSLDASKFTTGTFSKAVMPRRVIPSARTTSTNTNGAVTSEVVLASLTIPSGSLSIGDIIKVNAFYSFSSGTTKSARIRVGATSGIAGNLINVVTTLGSSIALAQFEGIYVVTAVTTMRFASVPMTPYGFGTAAISSISIPNITSSNIVFSFNGSSGTSTSYTLESAYVEIIKP